MTPLFRELPAGVKGAYRLFANLVSVENYQSFGPVIFAKKLQGRARRPGGKLAACVTVFFGPA